MHQTMSRQAPGEGASQNQRQLQIIATARKVTLMKMVIVFPFLICWVPFYISMALLYLGFVQNMAILFSVGYRYPTAALILTFISPLVQTLETD